MLGRARDDGRGVLDLEHDLMRPACARQPAPRPHLRDDELATAGQSELGTMPLSDLHVLDEAEHVGVPGDRGAHVRDGEHRHDARVGCGAIVSMRASVDDRSAGARSTSACGTRGEVSFERSLRALAADRGSRLWWVWVGLALLAGWSVWLLLAEVPIHVSSVSARLEAEAASHPVQVRTAGRVTTSRLGLGRTVTAGEI